MQKKEPMTTEDTLLSRLYYAYFPAMEGVNLHTIREDLALDEKEFWIVADRLEQQNLIRARAMGGYYEITAAGALKAENRGIINQEQISQNRRLRTRLLEYLANLNRRQGPLADAHISILASDLTSDEHELASNLQVLEDARYIQTFAMGSFKITGHGLNAVADWEKRQAFEDNFKAIEKLEPQARGRAFQRWLAEVIENYGWSSEPEVKTSNEEMDVLINKGLQYFLVECKWEKDPVEASIVRELYGKLTNRAGVNGVIVSMSGFTTGAIKQVEDYISNRAILLFGPNDIHSLIADGGDFESLLNGKYGDLMKRRKITFS